MKSYGKCGETERSESENQAFTALRRVNSPSWAAMRDSSQPCFLAGRPSTHTVAPGDEAVDSRLWHIASPYIKYGGYKLQR